MRGAIWCFVLSLETVRGVFEAQSAANSSRNVTVHETLLSSGSALVFSWTKCEQCDGYEAHIFLGNKPEQREISYRLNSVVTSLKITDVPPREYYRFVVRCEPPDDFKAEVYGRSSALRYPPPVESLVVEPVLNSSLRVHWRSKSADGFLVKIERDSTVIREETVMRSAVDSSIRISNLEPSTKYEVHVIAFYNGPEKATSSSVRTARTKTLPSTLPVSQVEWNIDTSLKLSWKNPDWPVPTMYGLSCFDGSVYVLNVNFGKGTTSVAFSQEESLSDYTNCTFRTWYDRNEKHEVYPDLRIPERLCNSIEHSMHYVMQQEGTVLKEEQPGVINVTFYLPRLGNRYELQHKLCAENAPCDNPWQSFESRVYFSLRIREAILVIRPEDRIPWVSQIIYYRLLERCSPFNSGMSGGKVESLKLPVVVGAVSPPSSVTAAGSRLSWNYASTPDYFVVTSCIDKKCKSLSIGGDRREVDLANRGWNASSPLLVQAVRLHAGNTYVSPPATITRESPEMDLSQEVSTVV